MVKSNAVASSPTKSRNRKSEKRMVRTPAAEDPGKKARLVDKEDASKRTQQHAPGVRLWGFVRRHEDVGEKTAELLTQDIAIWYDKKQCRFQIVSDHKVIDDLAPVEFVQFVRAFRYSTTQVLFKFERRHDETAGRPMCVWSAP